MQMSGIYFFRKYIPETFKKVNSTINLDAISADAKIEF